MGPDETSSNRLDALFEVTGRVFLAEILPTDEHVTADGHVMEVLSEHMCQGWLEGYLLTAPRILLMLRCLRPHRGLDGQPAAKWLNTARPSPLAPPDRLTELSPHLARVAAGSLRHQSPGFRLYRYVVNKEADVATRIFAAGREHALAVADHCLRSRNEVNVIVAGKRPAPQCLDVAAAAAHCTACLPACGEWECDRG